MIHYVVLTTGSCGNAYAFYDGETTLLVDCGVTVTKLMKELEAHSIPFDSISSLFLTHLHPDHAKGAGSFARKTGKPIYISAACFHDGKTELMKNRIDISGVNTFKWGETIEKGSFSITAFGTSHDSPGSSGFYIENGSSSFFLLTDTGIIPVEAYEYAPKSRVKFIEANYDEEMLLRGTYPGWLKERVRGRFGHLSNSDAVNFASSVSKRGDQLYFIHISENNNDTSILKKAASFAIESGIFIKCPERGEMFEGFIE